MIADLGHGGMSEVYLAVSQGMAGFQKLRVIKLLRADLGRDAYFVRMFLDEARLAARLSHPNIVQTNEVGEVEGRYFIDMEYIEGQSLSVLMKRMQKRQERMPPALAARVVLDALAGLQYAHEFADFDGTPLKVVHRDVSPHNMLVRYDGVVIVVDFGIAKTAMNSVATETGVIKGKVAYMAPEQAAGSHGADARVDVFAVGVVLHELLTGQRFWGKKADLEILHALYRSETAPSPRAVDASVPEALDAVVRRATEPRVQERYASAAEMAKDLESYLEASGTKVSHRDVAQLMTSLFEQERKSLRGLIDAQLKSVEAGTSAHLIELSTTITSDFGMSRSGASHTPSRSGDFSTPGDTAGTLPEATAARPRRVPWAALGLLLVGASAGAFVFTRRPAADPPPAAVVATASAAPEPPSVLPAASPRAAPEERTIRLSVAAEPAQARLYLDDAELPRNPYLDVIAMDPSVHRLRGELAGYAPKTVAVTFNSDVDVTLRLEKAPEGRRARGAAREAHAPPSAAPSAPLPPPKPTESAPKPKAPSLDETNPFR
jgi:serine/threonine-protein kinase